MGFLDSILPTLLNVLGSTGGAAVGDPAGATIGGSIGNTAGSAIGGGGGGNTFSLGNQGFSALDPMSMMNQASGAGGNVNVPNAQPGGGQTGLQALLSNKPLPGMSSTESALMQLYMQYVTSKLLQQQKNRTAFAPGFSAGGSQPPPPPNFSIAQPPQFALPRLG